jgi:hypothetical protein
MLQSEQALKCGVLDENAKREIEPIQFKACLDFWDALSKQLLSALPIVCGGLLCLWEGLVFQFEYYEFPRPKDPQYLRILDFSAGVDTHLYSAAIDISDTHSKPLIFLMIP